MKFKPILGSDLSGHIGGVVASHNTYGPYFRQRVRPVNRKTPGQQAQRSAIAAVSQTWRLLDPSVQAAWQAATIVKTSRKGDRVNLSGNAGFQFVNTLRQRAGISLFISPPGISVGTPDFTTPTVTFVAADEVTVTFADDSWNGADGAVILSAALLTSSGKGFATPNLAVAILIHPGTSPTTVTLPFAVPIGARVRIQFHATRPDGSQTTYTTVDAANPSFAPPSSLPLRVLSVSQAGSHSFLWTFNGPVTVAAIPDSHLIVDGDTSGTSDPAGLDTALVAYTTANSTTGAWSINAQPTSITELVAHPQSGTLV
jgi:hypothetical protein